MQVEEGSDDSQLFAFGTTVEKEQCKEAGDDAAQNSGDTDQARFDDESEAERTSTLLIQTTVMKVANEHVSIAIIV